jgi:hypothetical protein
VTEKSVLRGTPNIWMIAEIIMFANKKSSRATSKNLAFSQKGRNTISFHSYCVRLLSFLAYQSQSLQGLSLLIVDSELLLPKHHPLLRLSLTNHNTLLSLCWASV